MVLVSKALSRTSPKPLQNLSKNLSKSRPQKVEFAYVYIYSILKQPGLTLEREAPLKFRVQIPLENAYQSNQSNQTQTAVSVQICLREKEANQTLKQNIDKHSCLYLPTRLEYMCDFTCIQWFVCACKCLPVGASLGSLRSPRSAFEG